MRTDCALAASASLRLHGSPSPSWARAPFPAEIPPPSSTRARGQLSYAEPPLPSGPTPATAPDLSHEPSGGARRLRGPARTLGAVKPQRGGRGQEQRTPGRPRSGAAEAAAAPPGSGVGQGGQPEPTTSHLPWFALRPRRTAPPHGPPVGWSARHSGLAAHLLVLRVPLRSGARCPLVEIAVIPPLSSVPVLCVPPCFCGWTSNPSVHCAGGRPVFRSRRREIYRDL